jgi:hypothetical protein
MSRVSNPLPVFLDRRGNLLDGGKIYIGTPDADPESSPVQVYWDKDFTIPAYQPIRTIGGNMVNGSDPAYLFINAADWSIRVRDADDVQVIYLESQEIDAPTFQPLDTDLTYIAALTTTTFGRSLLTMNDANAVKSALSITTGLPLSGGTITGDIVRSGNGAYLWHTGPDYTSGRIFHGSIGAGDPTTSPGDIWLAWA